MRKYSLKLLLMISIIALLSSACSSAGSTPANGSKEPQKIKVSVGLPGGSIGQYIFEYMRQNKTFEQYAKGFNYDLEVEYKEFPGAPPLVEQMISGAVDFGYAGMIPLSQAIAKGGGITLLANPEGAMDSTISVSTSSPIKSVEDLKGKTIGTFVGGDQQFFLTQILKAALGGSGNPSEYGIKIVNLSSAAQMIDIPKGVDAVTTFYPQYLLGKEQGKLKMLLSNKGNTEMGDQPKVSFFNKAEFAPEAFFLHRPPVVVRTDFLKKNPDLVSAYLMAIQNTIDLMKEGKVNEYKMAELVQDPKKWGLNPELGAKAIKDTSAWTRGWIWYTEGDIKGSIKTLELMKQAGMIDKTLSLDDLKKNIQPAIPAIKKAYDTLKSTTYSESDFVKEGVDIRGLPVWKMDEWK